MLSAAAFVDMEGPPQGPRSGGNRRAITTLRRSSGSIMWSWSSLPTSIWTQPIVPRKRLVAEVRSGLTVVPLSYPTSVVSSAEKIMACVKGSVSVPTAVPS